jgi:hypothetical protein
MNTFEHAPEFSGRASNRTASNAKGKAIPAWLQSDGIGKGASFVPQLPAKWPQ